MMKINHFILGCGILNLGISISLRNEIGELKALNMPVPIFGWVIWVLNLLFAAILISCAFENEN